MHHHADAIARLVRDISPDSVICIGPDAPLCRPWAEAVQAEVCLVDEEPFDAPLEGRLFDLALVMGGLACMDNQRGTRLLARLRDINSRRLLVRVRLGKNPGARSHWEETDLLALGMVRLERRGSEGLYGFDIATYKTTPDWLNPKYWAHPERWDKDWW